ncbi:MAG: TadE/TadG family type IV pilus assembly protein [Hyphomicrobium sp.]
MKRSHRSHTVKCGRRFAISDAGAAAIEFAFVVPVLLAGLLLVVEFGRLFYSKVEFEYAMFSATRFGMVMKAADTDKVKKSVADNLILLNPANLKNVTLVEVVNADKTRTATLNASYQVNFMVPLTDHKSVTLSRAVTFLRAE